MRRQSDLYTTLERQTITSVRITNAGLLVLSPLQRRVENGLPLYVSLTRLMLYDSRPLAEGWGIALRCADDRCHDFGLTRFYSLSDRVLDRLNRPISSKRATQMTRYEVDFMLKPSRLQCSKSTSPLHLSSLKSIRPLNIDAMTVLKSDIAHLLVFIFANDSLLELVGRDTPFKENVEFTVGAALAFRTDTREKCN